MVKVCEKDFMEAVVLHGCTFCMSLLSILLETYLHVRVSSCSTYSRITSNILKLYVTGCYQFKLRMK